MGKIFRLLPNRQLPLIWPNKAFGTVAVQYSSNNGAGTVILAGRTWAAEYSAWAGNLSSDTIVTTVSWHQWFVGY